MIEFNLYLSISSLIALLVIAMCTSSVSPSMHEYLTEVSFSFLVSCSCDIVQPWAFCSSHTRHDWSDEKCVIILKNVRNVMKAGSKLVISAWFPLYPYLSTAFNMMHDTDDVVVSPGVRIGEDSKLDQVKLKCWSWRLQVISALTQIVGTWTSSAKLRCRSHPFLLHGYYDDGSVQHQRENTRWIAWVWVTHFKVWPWLNSFSQNTLWRS